MRVVRSSNPYVMINKTLLNNPDLSLKAKGLLAYMLSQPEDKYICQTKVAKHHKDDMDSLEEGFKELIENGYIIRQESRDNLGRLCGYHYLVFECTRLAEMYLQ